MDERIITEGGSSGADKQVSLVVDPTTASDPSGGGTVYSLSGTITDAFGDPIVGANIEGLWVRVSKVLIGSFVTNNEGRYLINFNGSQVNNLTSLSLQIRITRTINGVQEITNSAVVGQLGRQSIINFQFADDEGTVHRIPEYRQVSERLEAIDFPVEPDEIANIEEDQIPTIANSANIDIIFLRAYINAENLTFQISESIVTPEVIYGMLRKGISSNKRALLRTRRNAQRTAITSAVNDDIIDSRILTNLEAILDALFSELVRSGLDGIAELGGSLLNQLLTIGELNETEKISFIEVYQIYNDGNPSGQDDFWDVISPGVINNDKYKLTRMAFRVSILVQDFIPLVQNLVSQSSTTRITTEIQIADIPIEEWELRINAINQGIPGNDSPTDQEIHQYAVAIVRAVEKAYPTRTFRRYLIEENNTENNDLLEVLTRNTNFDIGTGDISFFVADTSKLTSRSETKELLYVLRRLWFLTSHYNKLVLIRKMLAQNPPITSAFQIVAFGRRSFIKRFGDELVDPEYTFDMAVKRAGAIGTLQVAHDTGINSINTEAFNSSLISNESLSERNNADQEVLGSFLVDDFCACKHCQSSLSPAAYLLDTIQFLQGAINNGEIGVSGQSAWEILMARRPEFAELLMSCENTNTTLPHIDLALEVMEHKVVAGEVDRQTNHSEAVLRTAPAYLNIAAYNNLRNAVYPMTLPFDFWHHQSNAYLSNKGLTRGELIRLTKAQYPWEQTIDISEAIVMFNIAPIQKDILADESQFDIYYKNATQEALQNLAFLLNRVGLSYNEFLPILDSRYLNTNGLTVNFDPLNDCDPDFATIEFSVIELQKLHKLVRLKGILDWDVSTIDTFLVNEQVTNAIGDAELIKLASIQQLANTYQSIPDDILLWYGPISTISYGDVAAYYDQVFLNDVYFQDNALKGRFEDLKNSLSSPISLATAGVFDPEISAILEGILRLQPNELSKAVIEELGGVGPDISLEINDITHLYRISTFLKATKWSYEEYSFMKSLIGFSPLSSVDHFIEPTQTMRFLGIANTLLSKFSFSELDSLYNEEITDEFTTALVDAIKIRLRAKLDEKEIGINFNDENLFNIFLLLTNEEVAARSVAIIQQYGVGQNVSLPAEESEFLEANWKDILPNDVVPYSTQINNSNQQLITDLYKHNLVEDLLFENEVLQLIADAFAINFSVAETLLVYELSHPQNSNATALSAFTDISSVFDESEFGLSDNIVDSTNQDIFHQLSRIALVKNNLAIDDSFVSLVMQGAERDWYDLKSFPDLQDSIHHTALCRLIMTAELERAQAIANDFSVMEFLSGIPIPDLSLAAIDPIQLSESLAEKLSLNTEDLNFLLSWTHLGITDQFHSEQWIYKISEIQSLLRQLPFAVSSLPDLIEDHISAESSELVHQIVKSTYDLETWLEIAPEIRDGLRKQQRDALTAYLIADRNFQNSNDLFSYLLLDAEIEPCFYTSRIKLAITTIQTWVQRIRMNLEPEFSFSNEDLDEWEWRKNFRVWEAARKIFIYPENWIEPELRDDKTPFFETLEDELLQDEVTPELVEQSYLNYLHQLDEVGRLEIAGCFNDSENNTFHVIGRTFNTPNIYYHRRLIDKIQWTPWERVDLDIEGKHLIPLVFNRRPYLFWPVFTEKAEPIANSNLSESEPSLPVPIVEIQMAFSEFKNGQWQTKKLSEGVLSTSISTFLENYFFKLGDVGNDLSIETYVYDLGQKYLGRFYLDDCAAQLQVRDESIAAAPSNFAVSNTVRYFSKLINTIGDGGLEITEKIQSRSPFAVASENGSTTILLSLTLKRLLLGASPHPYQVTYPIQGTELLSDSPFFYEDSQGVFFVNPEEEAFTGNLLTDLPGILISPIVSGPVEADLPAEDERPPTNIGDGNSSSGAPSGGTPSGGTPSGGGQTSGGSTGGGSTGGGSTGGDEGDSAHLSDNNNGSAGPN